MEKLKAYLKDTVVEMRHNVAWPSYSELQRSAGLVLIGSLAFALAVGVMDFVFDKALTFFYNSF